MVAALVVAMSEVMDIHLDIGEIADLPPGWSATRTGNLGQGTSTIGSECLTLEHLSLDQAASGRWINGFDLESSISRTATASCFSENGFGRKPNFASAGRLRAKASSA